MISSWKEISYSNDSGYGFDFLPNTLCGSYDGKRLFMTSSSNFNIGSNNLQWTSEDYGVNWTYVEPTSNYEFKACGSNANRRIILDDSSNLKLTLDDGSTYTTIRANFDNTNYFKNNVAVSQTLSTIYILQGCNAYRSRDVGQTWTTLTTLGERSLVSVACSYDGQFVAVLGDGLMESGRGNYLFLSQDFGSNWVVRANGTEPLPVNAELQTVCMSGNASTIATGGGIATAIFVSKDFGSNWFSNTPQGGWLTSATNSNGSVILFGQLGDPGYSFGAFSSNGSNFNYLTAYGLENSNVFGRNSFVSYDGERAILSGSNNSGAIQL